MVLLLSTFLVFSLIRHFVFVLAPTMMRRLDSVSIPGILLADGRTNSEKQFVFLGIGDCFSHWESSMYPISLYTERMSPPTSGTSQAVCKYSCGRKFCSHEMRRMLPSLSFELILEVDRMSIWFLIVIVYFQAN